MAGFENDVLLCSNVNFSPSTPKPHVGIVTLDGELLIGASVAPFIRAALPTTSDNTITITPGPGSLDFKAGTTVPTLFQTSSGNATPSGNIIKFIQGSGVLITGSGNTVTITSTGISSAGTITGDSGGALSQTAGNWNILGSGSITTSGAVSTLTTQLTGLTNHAVLVGAGTSTITKLAIGATNQVLLGNTGADPSWGTVPNAALTSSSITLSNGNNISISGSPVSLGGTATINVAGTTQHAIQIGNASNSLTSIAIGSTGQVLQANTTADPTWSTATFPSTATGTGTLLRADGTNWVATTSTYPNTNAINTLLYASSANVMSALTTANNGLLVTSSAGVPSILAGPGTTGQILQSNAAAAPSFSTATYPSASGGVGKIIYDNGTNFVESVPTFPASASATSGKIIISDGTNWIASTPTYPNASATSGKILISDGTNFIASTPTYPNTSGTAGKVLVSDGTNNVYSTPTFPNASATTRKIIISDGTNWVASTETYAVPGTSGNVLTSDGTNWTSAAPAASGGLTWSVISANQTATINNGYICNKAGTLTLTMPGTAAVGSIIAVVNINTATGAQFLSANPGQLNFGNQAATANTGTITSTAVGDVLFLICTTANTTWYAYAAQGNWTVA